MTTDSSNGIEPSVELAEALAEYKQQYPDAHVYIYEEGGIEIYPDGDSADYDFETEDAAIAFVLSSDEEEGE